mmetsp:Transcript_8973/g.40766  ORF Transcript_8973/g.40766 Transcript_8973/m.40766 type:complete len:212 (+) Transcript_8973:2239-2874(+)
MTECSRETIHRSARGSESSEPGTASAAATSSTRSSSDIPSREYRTNLPEFQILFVKLRLDASLSMLRFRSCPAAVPVARVNRSASQPCSSMTLSGSTTLPKDLDILRPFSSRTKPWRKTVWNGSLPVMPYDIMTMRATQKKRMSCPVSITCVGKNLAMSSASSSGHPSVENGQSPEENQVSKTSSSWYSTTCSPCADLACSVASASFLATT